MYYLHVLYMILMVSICVLYMTLMVFIYVYYGLFACTNLVDIMLLFFTVFLFNDQFSAKFDQFLPKLIQKSRGRFSEKVGDFSVKSADNLAKPAEIRDSRIQVFLRCF
jgi:small-conductance mechanosensitive channel